MTARIRSITFDCADHYRLARFWSEVTGYAELPDDPNHPDDPESVIVGPDGAALLFLPVPEGKAVKNRIHLDIVATDQPAAAELKRILGLGARMLDDRRTPDGRGWTVLADPEGNEFCLNFRDGETT